MTFGQYVLLAVIDTAVLGALILLVGFGLNRLLERYKSDLEWKRAVAAARTQAYRELWALTRSIGGTGGTTPLAPEERRSISTAFSEWYWEKGNGLFLSHATVVSLMEGWRLLSDQAVPESDIRNHYSSLRTHLKTESMVYTKEDAQTSVR